jgi:hypothetical protein
LIQFKIINVKQTANMDTTHVSLNEKLIPENNTCCYKANGYFFKHGRCGNEVYQNGLCVKHNAKCAQIAKTLDGFGLYHTFGKPVKQTA